MKTKFTNFINKKILIFSVAAIFNFSFFNETFFAADFYNLKNNLENEFENSEGIFHSISRVNWITKKFDSKINFDVEKSSIPMPAGKPTAINELNARIPDLIKNPLLTLNVDSERKLGDIVLNQDMTYPEVKKIIENGKSTLGFFEPDSSIFSINHTVKLLQISQPMIHHKNPYKLQKRIETVSSKEYTGIIIDARGRLPVHGEFLKEEIQPCFFPRIFSEKMNIIFEKNMVEPKIVKTQGLCHYDFSDDESKYSDLIGNNPIYILAQKSFGENRSDIIIKTEDALKIISIPENLNLLKNGKVVILLNKEKLIYDVSAPKKDSGYYTTLQKLKLYPIRELLGPDRIEDGPNGIKFLYNLKFIPNSPELLPEEKSRIEECAKLLQQALESNEFTIFVGGHTADIGQPENQMALSIARTQTIIKALIEEGIPQELFSYKGFGATIPAEGGDNTTSIGRAVNRRVEITLRPKITYIQRSN